MKEEYVISRLITAILGRNFPSSFYYHRSVSKGEVDASNLDVKACDVRDA